MSDQNASDQGSGADSRQYRAIFEATSDGLVINDPETGLVLEANPAFCRMHGYDQMVGMHPREFTHPDTRYLFEDYVRTASRLSHPASAGAVAHLRRIRRSA